MLKYDLCVIGGGPAGFAAVVRALDLKKKVLLIEKNKLGGAGIWDGALSSKTLWELSKDARKLSFTNRGYKVGSFEVSYPEVVRVMNEAVEQKHEQISYQLQVFENKIYPDLFRLVYGFGSFVSDHEVKITYPNGEEEVVYADNIIIATGSAPRKLPSIPIDEKTIVTSDGISSFDDFPESLVVLGAGVIGCEFATIFANFGKTKVYIIDKADKILPFEDDDISETVAKNFEDAGVTIHRNSSLASMSIEDGRVKYVLNYHDGRSETHYAEKALVSVGRENNVKGLNIEAAGVQVNARNCFVTDDSQTCIPHIYAVGDLTADACLVNVGEMEGREAVEKMFGVSDKPLSYNNISTIMFLSPEVAGVGFNEKQLQEKNIPYRVAKYSYECISRAICMRSVNGFFKIIVTDDDEMRLLGVRAIGEHASSTIQAAALLISMEKGIQELADLIHPHPSITEGIQDACRMLLGKSIMKPRVFKNKLQCCRWADGEKHNWWKDQAVEMSGR